jgi:hypothetical protein
MTIAILSEDKYNEAVRILAERTMGEGFGVELVTVDREILRRKWKKVREFIRQVLRDNNDVSKIVICVDSECTPEEKTEHTFEDCARRVQDHFRDLPVRYCIVLHALEGWLLGDINGVKQYLPRKVHISRSSTLVCKPKELLKKAFEDAGKRFLPSIHYAEIAKMVDINRVAMSNPSFANFQKEIRDP